MKLILQAIKALFRKIEASRTHWDTRRIVTKEYTFDGNIDGKETIQINENTIFVKISDTFPEVSSITSLSIVYTSIPEGLVDEYELSPIDDVQIEGGIYLFDGGAFYTSSGGEFEGIHIPSGLYFNYFIDDKYTSKLSVTYNDGELKKLDKKYLPDEVIESIGIANNAQTTANNAQTTANNAQTTANNAQTTANNAQTTANNAQTTVNSKMNAYDPVGTGSFSMGRKANSVVGNYSHAEGYDTTASGKYSHAEGYFARASGNYSHAECYDTTASGDHSHAEGRTATASGKCSHAEGYSTTASGNYSHAEGYSTYAYSVCQHVQGKYNVEDYQNKYAHIVGNGTSLSDGSNAHTLDWKGVPWFQGRPQFGGKAQDQGSQTVMANGDKEIILASSTAGSTKKFKITVDDSGVITATEVTT